VHFEFGAGWLRGIPVIPVCHSGLSIEMLVPPLSIFQGLNLCDDRHLSQLYRIIANTLDCAVPSKDFGGLGKKYYEITEINRVNTLLQGWLKQLIVWNPEIINVLNSTADSTDILIPLHLDPAFQQFREIAAKRELLILEPKGAGMGTRIGPQAGIYRLARGSHAEDLTGLLKENPL
jgi:hypothetical protein